MNVTVRENSKLNADDVVIECGRISADIDAAVELLRAGKSTVIGIADGRSCVIRLTDVLYFESVDKNGFFYTRDGVYRTELRLYEAEEKYKQYHFVRVSKSMVVNMLTIDEISPYLAGKLRLKLSNGEFILVSRQYSQNIRHELGMGR